MALNEQSLLNLDQPVQKFLEFQKKAVKNSQNFMNFGARRNEVFFRKLPF